MNCEPGDIVTRAGVERSPDLSDDHPRGIVESVDGEIVKVRWFKPRVSVDYLRPDMIEMASACEKCLSLSERLDEALGEIMELQEKLDAVDSWVRRETDTGGGA